MSCEAPQDAVQARRLRCRYLAQTFDPQTRALLQKRRPCVLGMYANPLRNREQIAAGRPAPAAAPQQPAAPQSVSPSGALPPQATAGASMRPAAP